MKLCSLFDGSGAFPLAGILCGIEPMYASEVEPYPIAVTKSRFPSMTHLGDVSKIDGGKIEPVDIVTFGSPCQDLSVAGKRAGLKHGANGDGETTRSGLFMEAVRIIKEMREATNGEYPAFAVWENVPGAFSSNKGEDFRIVLEELIKIAEPNASVPPAGKSGWPYADIYVGDGWSLAYRTFDAQYWGVPQRRRRIYLVADFRGECAGEILFKRKGVQGHPSQNGSAWKETPAYAKNSPLRNDSVLGTEGAGTPPLTLKVRCGTHGCIQGNAVNRNANEHHGVKAHNFDGRGNGDGEIASTITDDHEGHISDYTNILCISVAGVDCRNGTEYPEMTGTLQAKSNGGQSLNTNQVVRQNYIVRRLTPPECRRLQGFPDGWGEIDRKEDLTDEEYIFWLEVINTHAAVNGKKPREYTKGQMLKWYNALHTDSAEYKMWGNGIALPCALYVMQGIQEERR